MDPILVQTVDMLKVKLANMMKIERDIKRDVKDAHKKIDLDRRARKKEMSKIKNVDEALKMPDLDNLLLSETPIDTKEILSTMKKMQKDILG
jgi:hypothetical protein